MKIPSMECAHEKNTGSIGRYEIIKCLPELTGKCIQGISDKAVKVTSVWKNDGTKLHSPFILSSYIGDITECENMCVVNRDGNTTSPCNRCLISKWQLPFNKNDPKWSIEESMD